MSHSMVGTKFAGSIFRAQECILNNEK